MLSESPIAAEKSFLRVELPGKTAGSQVISAMFVDVGEARDAEPFWPERVTSMASSERNFYT